MNRGKFKMFDTQRGFGFISTPEFPSGIFTHTKSIWLPPGEFPLPGDECTFDVGHDRLDRPVANNVRITRRAPAVVDPGRQYEDRMLSARRRVRERAVAVVAPRCDKVAIDFRARSARHACSPSKRLKRKDAIVQFTSRCRRNMTKAERPKMRRGDSRGSKKACLEVLKRMIPDAADFGEAQPGEAPARAGGNRADER
jgi:cold shock CspA family protein